MDAWVHARSSYKSCRVVSQGKGDPAQRPRTDASAYATGVFAAQSAAASLVYAAAVNMFEAQYAAVVAGH